MLKTIAVTMLAAAALAGAGDKAPTTVQAGMTQVFAPGAQAIWDVTNRATDDAGQPDPAKISADDWSRLGEAGGQMRDAALGLVRAGKVVVAGPGVKIQDEGVGSGAGAAQVQGYVDANPDLFANHFRRLAETGAAVAEASRTRDTARLFAVANDMDQVCEACHVQFWYPPAAK